MMRAVLLMSALTMISGLIGTGRHATFAACAGNACGSVQLTFTSPCYNVRNTGSQPVKVEFRPLGIASSLSKVLGPGENWQPIQPFTTQCMGGFIEPFNANFAANAPAGEEEMTFGLATLPKESRKPLNATILWNTAPTQQMGLGNGVIATKRNYEGLKKQGSCPGEFTVCVAAINDPEHQNLMVVHRATEIQDAKRRANQCRSDVTQVTCYSSSVFVCAPYITCDAP